MFAPTPPQKPRLRQTTSLLLRFEQLERRVMLTLNPTAMEQEMLEHINRTRMFPHEELDVIFTDVDSLISSDLDITQSAEYFNVDSATLQLEMAALVPVPPLAWNESLCDSAEYHVGWMIAEDGQSHQFPGEPDIGNRFANAGYTTATAGAENVFAWPYSVFYGHAGFFIDWGVPDLGHRINTMAPNFNEIGISIVPETDPTTDVGPLVITEDFGQRWDYGNPNVLGVVFDDANSNGRYDAGEQASNVDIEISGPAGTFNTTTMTAGGYQVQVPAGTYTVTASGASLASPRVVEGVVVGSDNVKVDFNLASQQALPVSLDIDGNGQADALTDGILILRHLFGFSDTALTDGALAPNATRTDPDELASMIEQNRSTLFDVDQNGSTDALSDGILILRHLFEFSGDALTNGVIGPGATRTDPGQIAAFLNGFIPSPAMPQADALLETIALDTLRVRSAQANRFTSQTPSTDPRFLLE